MMRKEFKYLGRGFAAMVREEYGLMCLHCTVTAWNRETYLEIFDALEDALWRHKKLYAVVLDDQQERFCQMFGGTESPLMCKTVDGVTRRVYEWE
jgi:hypothetical protein